MLWALAPLTGISYPSTSHGVPWTRVRSGTRGSGSGDDERRHGRKDARVKEDERVKEWSCAGRRKLELSEMQQFIQTKRNFG